MATSDSYLRLAAWSDNQSDGAIIHLSLQAVRSLTSVSGTLKLGSGTQSVSSGAVNPGGTVASRTSSKLSYEGSSVTVSISFVGTATYEDEEGETYTVSSNISGYYTANNPVQTAITTNLNSVALGSTIRITTSGGSSAAALKYKAGNMSSYETIRSQGNTYYDWTPPIDGLAQKSPNSATMTCTFSWNGVTKSVTLTVPNNSTTKPTVSAPVMSVAEPSGWSTYVQSKGKATATTTATAKFGASISSYKVVMNGQTITSASNVATSGYLANSGSNTCTVTVTDSRGFTASASTTFSVVAYSSPRLSAVSIYRSDSSGNAASGGAYVTYKFTPTITSTGNTNQNAKKYRLGYRVQGTSSWSYWNAEANLSDYTSAVTLIRGGSLSTTTIYETYLYIKDSFETVSTDISTIPTEAVIMDFNSAGTGGGIGMYTQAANYLDVAWKIRARDGVNIPWTGTGVTSTTYLAVFDSNKNIVPMNKDYISGGGGGSSVNIHTFNTSNSKTVGTSYTYSGISVTIPANSYYTFRYALWKESSSAGSPSGILLTSSSTSCSWEVTQQEKLIGTSGFQLEDTYSDYTESSSVTWYLWVKAASSTTLSFRIKGWYIQNAT